MNQQKKRPKGGPWFTFDDIPIFKRRERMLEISAWVDLQKSKPNFNFEAILRELISRFVGSMRDYFTSLGDAKQLMFTGISIEDALGMLHAEFVGNLEIFHKRQEQEFYQMKCCSLEIKDLQRHYQRMARTYYQLGGYNSRELRQTFVTSFSEELLPEVTRQINILGRDLGQHGLGELFQYVEQALEKLCEQKKFFKQFSQNSKIQKACDKSYLKIKCKDKDCHCRVGKKKQHWKKYSKKQTFRRSKKGFKHFKKKGFRSFRRKTSKKKSDRCFICGQKGHYAKNCPNKKKSAKLLQ